MSLRCVSKCFIGGRSFRVYSLLLLGVVFGFTLSTVIQTFGEDLLRPSTHRLQRHEPFNVPLRAGEQVAFSNLRKEGSEAEEEQPSFEFGDYGYEGDPDPNWKQVKEPEAVAEKVQVKGAGAGGGADAPLPSLVVPEAVKLKMREYQSQSWQGRSMMEDNNGLPPNKLSEELASRQTVLVAVITSVTKLMTQTLAVQGTWAPQASQVIFFVGDVDVMPHLPHGMVVLELEGVDDKADNWSLKEISAVKYLMDHYLERTDWFMIIGDQTYVVTDHLEQKLNSLDASIPVYMGLAGAPAPNGRGLLCKCEPGVIYSRTLLENLKPYLPACWPGVGGGRRESDVTSSLSSCIAEMGVKCTQAKEVSVHFAFRARA